MKTVNLGSFLSNGTLTVTDPCYTDSKNSLELSSKTGSFVSLVNYGKLKFPLFPWDKHPWNFRVSSLLVIHEDYVDKQDSLKFFNKGTLNVNSGTMGVFPTEKYRKTLSTEKSLIHKNYQFMRELLGKYTFEIEFNQNAIKEGKDSEFVREMMKESSFKTESELFTFLKDQIQSGIRSLEMAKESLKTKVYPYYLKVDKTTDFSSFVGDLTCGEHWAGCDSEVGVNCRTGKGDGSYSVKIATGEQKEVVAILIEFIKLREFESLENT